jgi:hypothetical protein
MDRSKEHIEAQLCAYIDGELTDAERAEIEHHLASNPHHRKLIQELRLASEALRSLPRARVPTELNEALTGQLERTALLDANEDETAQAGVTINRWPQITAVAAVLLLAVGLGAVVYYVLPASTRTNSPLAVDDKFAKRLRPTTDDAATRPGTVFRRTSGDDALMPAAAAQSTAPAPGGGRGSDAAREPSVPAVRLTEEKKNLSDAVQNPAPTGDPTKSLAARDLATAGGTGGAAAARPNLPGPVAGGTPAVADFSLHTAPQSGALDNRGGMVSGDEVSEIRRRVLAFGEGNAAFDAKGERNLYLVVSSPKAAVASSQVTAFFNSNGIQYMNAPASATLAATATGGAPLAAAKAGPEPEDAGTPPTAAPRAPAEFKPTYPPATPEAIAGRGGSTGERSGSAAGAGGSPPTAADAIVDALNKQKDLSIAPQPSRPPLGLGEGKRDKDADGTTDRGFAQGGGGGGGGGRGASAGVGGGGATESLVRPGKPSDASGTAEPLADGKPGAAVANNDAGKGASWHAHDVITSKAKAESAPTAATAPANLETLSSRSTDAYGLRGVNRAGVSPDNLGRDDAAARGERMILARMNRRQVAELRDVLSREAGQIAHLVEPGPVAGVTFADRDEKESVSPRGRGTTTAAAATAQSPRAERYREGGTASTELQAANNPTAGAFASDGVSAQGAQPSAGGRRMMERAAPASRPVANPTTDAGRRYAAPTTNPASGSADQLYLNRNPLDEPVDVVIVVKDASAVAPATLDAGGEGRK